MPTKKAAKPKPSAGLEEINSDGNKQNLIIIALVIAILVVGFLGMNLLSSDTEDETDQNQEEEQETVEEAEPTEEVSEPTQEPEPSLEPTTTETESESTINVSVPADWKKQEFDFLEFVAYRPSWFYRASGGNLLELSPNEISDSSPGVIQISESNTSTFTQRKTDLSADLNNTSESEVTYPNGNWTVVSGTNGKVALMEKNGITFAVKLIDLNYEDNFNIVTGTLEFK